MLFNKFSESKEWLTTLDYLHKTNPYIYLIIFKMFLNRLNDNKIKIAFKTVFENLLVIKSTKE